MRLSPEQVEIIRHITRELAGPEAKIWLFGSRLDDTAKGGDVDLMLELNTPAENPALLSAQLSAKISRAFSGRKVDVLISAPNLLRLPIHDIAFEEGQLL